MVDRIMCLKELVNKQTINQTIISYDGFKIIN